MQQLDGINLVDINLSKKCSSFQEFVYFPPYIYDFVQDQTTPLHYAAAKGHSDIVKVLLEKEANVNAKKKVRFT